MSTSTININCPKCGYNNADHTCNYLTSDEYLNCDLKDGDLSGVPARTKGQLNKKALSHLKMLQKRPDRVKKYFKHPKTVYAA